LPSFNNISDSLFILKAGKPDNEKIWERQEALLSDLVKTHIDDREFIKFLFRRACNFSYDRRRKLIQAFLQETQNFEFFKEIPLESGHDSWSGSRVPLLDQKRGYYESLLPLFASAKLLKHRFYIQEKINRVTAQIEGEKKRDFIGIY
jgi:hypothetical protein